MVFSLCLHEVLTKRSFHIKKSAKWKKGFKVCCVLVSFFDVKKQGDMKKPPPVLAGTKIGAGATVFLLLLLSNDVEQNPGPMDRSVESKRQDRLENFVK